MRPYLLIAAAAVALAACNETTPAEPGVGESESVAPGDGTEEGPPEAPGVTPTPTPTTSPTPTPTSSPTAPATACGAEKAARFVGRTATPDVRAQVIEAVGHNRFRWIGPDTVVTMDFREDRLNVDLTAANRITRFRCG